MQWWVICTQQPWLAATDPSTGCACQISIRRPALRHSWTPRRRDAGFWHRPGPATAPGSVRVTDFMPARDDSVDMVRIVEGLNGSVRMKGELLLRFDYGRIVPWVRRMGYGISAIAGPDAAYLSTPAPARGQDMRTI